MYETDLIIPEFFVFYHSRQKHHSAVSCLTVELHTVPILFK